MNIPEQPEAIERPASGQLPLAATDSRGKLGLGIATGLIAAIVGAVLWAVITVTTEYQIGFMAIAVGLLVGFAVRQFGNGTTQAFGFVGGILSLAGCALGNLLSIVGFISAQESMPIADVASIVLRDLPMIASLMRESFDPMDLLFYGIAVYEGYKIAIRPAAAVG